MDNDQFYFRQLLSGRDLGEDNQLARQMVNFMYLIGDRKTGEAVVVDPAYDPQGLVNLVEADGMKAAKDTADNIKKSIPGRKMRSNDKKDGDNTIIPAATPVKDPAAKIAKMESYGISGSKVSNSLLNAIAMVEDLDKKMTVDIDHDTGTSGSHEKKHGITLKKGKNYGKGPGSNMSTFASGKKRDLQNYLKKHYDGDHKTMHPEIYK